MNAKEFLEEKENEVQNLFKDWHIEKLASVMEEFAEQYAKSKQSEVKDDLLKENEELKAKIVEVKTKIIENQKTIIELLEQKQK